MKAKLTITNVGREALAAAGPVGPDAIEITAIAIGGWWTTGINVAAATAVQREITRTEFRGDAGTSPGTIAGYGLFEGEDDWKAWEIGVYARVGNSDEILFAYALSVINDLDIRVPLMVKEAGKTARYDFAFIFPPMPAAPKPAPPTPCCTPATAPCFTPPTSPYLPYCAPPPAPPAPPEPPAPVVWRSINTRAPDLFDLDFPVGHVWTWEGKEWTKTGESRLVDLPGPGEPLSTWKQTRGSVLIYHSSSGVESGDYRLSGNFAFTDFTAFEFIAVGGWRAHSTATAFSDNPVRIGFAMYAASARRGEELTISQTSDTRFWLSITRQAAPPDIKLSKIYGIY